MDFALEPRGLSECATGAESEKDGALLARVGEFPKVPPAAGARRSISLGHATPHLCARDTLYSLTFQVHRMQ